ncbi:ImmA/IrrE family metallo-endopeptidase [Marinibaculum pumilum]|uniref:ImmA/IrrE family metallo-endopeptidase n=1 Tax=Marinibaculum pumilum TaxID=1766165 RepID=A0ABV7L2D7_9PROT
MEIDDAGGDPARLAKAILDQMPGHTGPVPVRDIATALDIIEIRESALDGLEGGLIAPSDKSEGAILVNARRSERRKRYTIGHELGHYVNPWHRPATTDGFRCRAADMVQERFNRNDRAAKMEVEANQFAAELLMPSHLMNAFLRNCDGAEMQHILDLSDEFDVSRESAARRYVSRANEPCAIVFSRDGIVRYAKAHQRFPRLAVWGRDPLPSGCLSLRSDTPQGTPSQWAEVSGDIWLSNADRSAVYEQTIAQKNNFRMTLLTLDEADEDVYDDAEEEWVPPTLHRSGRR